MIVACIPAYNEGQTIGGVVAEACKFVDRVIVCDDGSSDDSAQQAEENGATVIVHKINRGKGHALKSAFREAVKLEPDVVVMLDSDGQHTPQDIPAVVQPILDGLADVVIGSRYLEGSITNPPFYRRIGLSIIKRIYSWSGGARITDTQSGFRAFNKQALIEVINSQESGYNVETDQLFRLFKHDFKIIEIPIHVTYNVPNPSKKTPLSHGFAILQYLLNYIIFEKPLQFVGLTGLISSVTGLFTTLIFINIYNKTYYFSIPWALISLGLILMGILLVMSSVILYSIKNVLKYLS